MTHLITLQQIRDKSPCQSGWKKLLTTLGNPTDLSIKVSIGDVAKSNGAQDALWCLRCVNDRRFSTSLVLPAVRRASTHTTDTRVHECIALLGQFVDGQPVYMDVLKGAADAAANAANAAAYADAAANDADAERAAQINDIILLSPLYALK